MYFDDDHLVLADNEVKGQPAWLDFEAARARQEAEPSPSACDLPEKDD